MRDLDRRQLGRQVDRVIEQLSGGDLRSAEVKKLRGHDLFRARLDDKNRLLFRFARHANRTVILALEIVHNHDYAKARFLNGASFTESDFEPASEFAKPAADSVELRLVRPDATVFHFLDKPLCFDEIQESVYAAPLPLIVIGSAGSGKTALTLEKVRTLPGQGLYLTRSQYLVESARALYGAHRYENDGQEVDFLSLKELIETIRVPDGREATWADFADWFERVRGNFRLREPHKVYEEIKGVITGAAIEAPHLDLQAYANLGVRQTIFLGDERVQVFRAFERWKQHLASQRLYDSNMIAWHTRTLAKPTYDFLVIDEVQDVTTVELELAFAVLKDRRSFLLSGDSNQIVHPNLFSWARLKSVFSRTEVQGQSPLERIHLLSANYRNTRAVTALANRLLLIKQKRFGSVDRESNYLVQCTSLEDGHVDLVADGAEVRREIDDKTRRSTKYAVIVLRDEDKAAARASFATPLVFSVHEAKGLEYENVILFNLIASAPTEFRECSAGVEPADLDSQLDYARARDKTDKSLDAYKFYINALYVSITRAVRTLIVVESDPRHPLFALLAMRINADKLAIEKQESSNDDWQREARKLELQGKKEQAEQIRRDVLGQQPVPWLIAEPLSYQSIAARAFDERTKDKAAQQLVFEYAVTNGILPLLPRLVAAGFRHAKRVESGLEFIERTHYKEYGSKQSVLLDGQLRRHGIDHRNALNETPLMVAARLLRPDLVKRFLAAGADPNLVDSAGRTPLRLALQSWFDKRVTKVQFMVEVYEALAVQALKVKVGTRMMKVEPRTIEWLLANFLLLQTRNQLAENDSAFPFPQYRAASLAACFAKFPNAIVPLHRKRPQYVSSILSKNEVCSPNAYSRRLVVRVAHGVYLLNPLLELDQGGEWVKVTDLLQAPHVFECLGDASTYARSWLHKTITQLERLVAEPAASEGGQA